MTAFGGGASLAEIVRFVNAIGVGPSDLVAILVSGRGGLLSRAASSTDLAMALCAGDVLQRTPEGAQLTYIQPDDCPALLNWDAEKYRQAIVY